MPDDDNDGDDEKPRPSGNDEPQEGPPQQSKSGLPLSLEEMATMATMTI